ncbi:MAG: hypothetical protein U9P80_10260 [Thermodesulfobacteriota bacterium]|nr:hypothetical protein [Thermodesulfobacteriota bacterium]
MCESIYLEDTFIEGLDIKSKNVYFKADTTKEMGRLKTGSFLPGGRR